ncbi:MAG: mercury transporter MerT [Alphaproteobacteria bacterium]|nr:mercury transporter MerT [Alphaproteobacteria bacterium]
MIDTEQNPKLKSVPGSGPRRWLAVGGVVGAVLASSCCVLPLALVTLGASGAWIGQLTLLEPFKPVFLLVAAVFIGVGFWHVYFRAKPACEDGSYCARPESSLITQLALWIAAALVVVSATIDWWAKFFY